MRKYLKAFLIGCIVSFIIVFPLSCDLFEPCDSYKATSNGVGPEGARVCKAACETHFGDEYDKVKYTDGQNFECYCCR